MMRLAVDTYPGNTSVYVSTSCILAVLNPHVLLPISPGSPSGFFEGLKSVVSTLQGNHQRDFLRRALPRLCVVQAYR